MHHHHHFNGRLGMIIGAVMGLLNGIMSMAGDIMATAILAVIGSTVGYFTNMFWQYIREKFNK